MQISVAPNSTASAIRAWKSSGVTWYASGERLPCPKPQNAQPTMQTLVKLMLRLTTNVAVSPGELGPQLVGGAAHLLDHLRAALGEQRRELVLGEQLTGAPALDRARRRARDRSRARSAGRSLAAG